MLYVFFRVAHLRLNFIRRRFGTLWLFHLHRQVVAECRMLYAFFYVIPRRLNFIFRRFGTLCLFHLHRQVGAECCMLSSGLFPGVWILYADVSKHPLFHLHRQVGTECRMLCVNKPHCAAAVRPWESEATTSTLPPARVRTCSVLSGSC